jgi:hypothetical protein
MKLVPGLVRYFTPEKRVQTKVIEFHNLKGKTAVVLTTYIMNVLNKCKLSDKVIAFCGDNCTQILEELHGEEQCFCQAKDEPFKNEHSGYRMCHSYFA